MQQIFKTLTSLVVAACMVALTFTAPAQATEPVTPSVPEISVEVLMAGINDILNDVDTGVGEWEAEIVHDDYLDTQVYYDSCGTCTPDDPVRVDIDAALRDSIRETGTFDSVDGLIDISSARTVVHLIEADVTGDSWDDSGM